MAAPNVASASQDAMLHAERFGAQAATAARMWWPSKADMDEGLWRQGRAVQFFDYATRMSSCDSASPLGSSACAALLVQYRTFRKCVKDVEAEGRWADTCTGLQ